MASSAQEPAATDEPASSPGHESTSTPLHVESMLDEKARPNHNRGSDGGMGDKLEKGESDTESTFTANQLTTATHADETTHTPHKPWYRTPNPLRWGAIPPVPQKKRVCPEHQAGWYSKLMFNWMSPLMKTGYKRPLAQEDLWDVNPVYDAELMSSRLHAALQSRRAQGDKYPLLWALHEIFFWDFWLGALYRLIATLLSVLQPLVLRFLIQFATDAYIAANTGRPAPSIGKGVGLAIGVAVMQLVLSVGANHSLYRSTIMGGMSRASLIGLIYQKSMVISGRARSGGGGGGGDQSIEPPAAAKKKAKKGRKPARNAGARADDETTGWSNGRIITLMSIDAARIDDAAVFFHFLWAAPLIMVLTLILLLVNITYSALVGYGLIAMCVPLLGKAMKSLFIRRRLINKVTDQRVSLTQEIVQSVRFVKFLGWESSFLDRLASYRVREIRALQMLFALRNAIMAFSFALPILASMLAFITYNLTHSGMSAAEIFSSLALFNGLRVPLNLLPLVIGRVADASSSLTRLQEFILSEEQEEGAIRDPERKDAIEMHSASFTWEHARASSTEESEDNKNGPATGGKSSSKDKQHDDEPPSPQSLALSTKDEPFKLRDLTFEIGRSELVAVIGGVGSGKSSFLAALAGDMRKTDGEVMLGASRALCPQYAWIQNTSVRDNILFGSAMDRARYEQVIEACALKPDLESLPNHDLTEIGERGITISGGQKQRINIARAIYFNAEIVIMDDPLSAVDAHVGRHIFDNAILGLLKDKARILATHQSWVLSRCDRIIVMEDGQIQAIGTFDDLLRTSTAFQHLMESTAVGEHEQDDEVDEVMGDADASAADGGASVRKVTQQQEMAPATLMQSEERAASTVPWSVYGAYLSASGTWLNAPLAIFLLVIAQGSNIISSLWLAYWISDQFGWSTGAYIGMYVGLTISQAVLMYLFMLSVTLAVTNASRKMFQQAMTRVLRAQMSFFDTTPVGRITNRFSRDVEVLDNNMTESIRFYLISISSILSTIGLVIAYFPYFAIALGPLSMVYVMATIYYRSSAREIKRFESVLRSVVSARFSEGLLGVACIRAYGLQERFVGDLHRAIDDMNSAYYLTFSTQRWLTMRLDLIGVGLVFTTSILVVTSRFHVNPSIGGLVLSYILAMAMMIQLTVRQLAEVESGMNSVERMLHYGQKLEEEAPLKTIDVPEAWPAKGEIVFEDVEMRYRHGLPLVLRGVNMHIEAGQRIGIVGRTGAGKSSIMTALFRLVELSGGRIVIDGLDISTIGLHDLRSRLAIIPQDPTLFRGTVRSNLDPFDKHSDPELWSALRQAGLVSRDGPTSGSSRSSGDATGSTTTPATTSAEHANSTHHIHLDSVVEEEGLNFSLGQRQLLALARVLVRGAQILVCDEATSSVDMDTDAQVQAAMAAGFAGKTMLCIAHRLHTIIGYDRICVMDAGQIAEMAPPRELWRREGGIFRSMCEQSGIREEDIVRAKK